MIDREPRSRVLVPNKGKQPNPASRFGSCGSPGGPVFGGANSGVADDHPTLPDTWRETENVVWSAPVPGQSWSSPVVWGDVVFLTSAISSGKEPVPERGHRPDDGRRHEVQCCAPMGGVRHRLRVRWSVPMRPESAPAMWLYKDRSYYLRPGVRSSSCRERPDRQKRDPVAVLSRCFAVWPAVNRWTVHAEHLAATFLVPYVRLFQQTKGATPKGRPQ